ncbi:hypothetical protein ACIRQO_21710 [Streptomyces anulatus]
MASGDADGGGWDGGWRRVAPPSVTVARSSIGVSDGLRFRSRLASWQNPALGGELGHSVLPSAPVGLIHGVARPGAARSASPGGPLLLRAVRPPGADEPAGPTTDLPSTSVTTRATGRSSRTSGGTGTGTGTGKPSPGSPPVQRSGTARGPAPSDANRSPSGASGASGSSGTAAATAPARSSVASGAHTPAAVRPQRIAPPLIVARRPAMPLRQIAGLAPATPTVSASPASAPSSSAAPSGPAAAPAVQRSGSERWSGPDRTVPEGGAPSPDRASGRPAADVVRPALGKPLREMPAGARTAGPDGPAGVVPSAPATAHPAAEMPVLQRQASDPPSAPSLPAPTPATPASRSVGPTKASASAPASARQQPSSPDTRSPAPQPSPSSRSARPSGSPAPSGSSPSVQRAPRPDASGSARARARGGIGTPLPSLPPTARLGGDAPLLGGHESTGTRPDPGRVRGPGPAVPAHVPAPAPADTPSAMPVRSASVAPPVLSAPSAPSTPAASSPGTPAVQRAADPARSRTAPAAAAPPQPVRVRPVAWGRTAAQGLSGTTPSPSVQRSRTLLSGRALTVNTGSAEGFSAPPKATAGGSTARPVVAATWRRDVRQPGADAPSPSPADGRTGGGPSAGPRQPASSGTAPGATVQRSATAPPTHRGGTAFTDQATGTATRTAGPTGRRGGSDPGRAPGTQAAPTGRGPSAGGVLQRLVRRSGRATTPPPTPPGTPPQQRASGPAAVRQAQQQGSARHTAPASGQARASASAPAPAPIPVPVPVVQRATPLPHALPARPGTPPGPSGPSTPSMYSASATAPGTRPVPVVRPHPPAAARPEAAVPVQRLAMPVAPESAGPPLAGPAPVGGGAPGGPPGLNVRVPPRAPAQAAGAGRPESRAQAVQRAAANAGITGVPVQAAPPKPAAGATPAATGSDDASDAPPANRLSGTEIEELARRLLDPVSRLIRADLRRGRERSGRLHDGRR